MASFKNPLGRSGAKLNSYLGISGWPLLRAVDRWGCVGKGKLNAASISYIVKALVAAAGFNPKLYSGHSLRSGFVTAASAGGASERQIMHQTGHKSRVMIDRDSYRELHVHRVSTALFLTRIAAAG